MTADEFRTAATAAAISDAKKIAAIRKVLRTYFEVDPWTGDYTGLYDDMFTAQDALDQIVEILK